jgi:hypothetical protein
MTRPFRPFARAVLGPLVIAAVVLPVVARFPAVGAAIVPPANPASNISPSSTYQGPCGSLAAPNPACPAGLLTIDADRYAEGLVPMSLPTNFATLSAAQQIFVLTNLERVDRGLAPVEGLSESLDNDAQVGADDDTDPAYPPYGSGGGSNWSGGDLFTSDANWMYDDGWDGAQTSNEDCTSPSAPLCWGHRDLILGAAPSPTLMGAGDVAGGAYGGSVAEVFVRDDTTDAPYYSWSQVTPALPIGTYPSNVDVSAAPGGASIKTVTLWASGEAMDLHTTLSGGGGAFTLNSSGCNLAAGSSCGVVLAFAPRADGSYTATLVVSGPNGTQDVPLHGAASPGYRLVAADGGVFSFGGAPFYGSAGSIHLNRPIVGLAATPGGGGYWLVASDGGIFSYGDAKFYGSTGARRLNQPIVGMAATPDGRGYWLVASDGGIFSFGDAKFYGSTGARRLNRPIVGMAALPDGGGYWLVASDGGIFSFGSAAFHGSTGALALREPVVGMAAAPNGGGYWLVAADGGIFSFGDAPYEGSTGGLRLNAPVVGLAATPDGTGYWLTASDGGIFNFGEAAFYGSMGGSRINAPIVGVSAGPASSP